MAKTVADKIAGEPPDKINSSNSEGFSLSLFYASNVAETPPPHRFRREVEGDRGFQPPPAPNGIQQPQNSAKLGELARRDWWCVIAQLICGSFFPLLVRSWSASY